MASDVLSFQFFGIMTKSMKIFFYWKIIPLNPWNSGSCQRKIYKFQWLIEHWEGHCFEITDLCTLPMENLILYIGYLLMAYLTMCKIDTGSTWFNLPGITLSLHLGITYQAYCFYEMQHTSSPVNFMGMSSSLHFLYHKICP